MLSRRNFLATTAAAGTALAAPAILRARTRTFRMGHTLPATHPYHLGLVKFKEEIEARTEGAVKVEVYPSAQIGGELAIIEGMGLGTVDGGAAASGSIPPAVGVDRFHLLDMPYLFKDYEAVERFATGEVGDEFRAGLPEEAGFHILGYGASGFHQVLNNIRPIDGPDDLDGLKLRVWEAPGAKLALELMGANPTPMAYAEVFTSVQQGVVDGLTNSMTTLYQTKMYEVASNLSMTRHAYVWVPMMLSDMAFQSVGEPEQKEIREAGEVACAYWRGLLPKDDANYEAKFAEAGTEINQADQAAFRTHVEQGYDRYADIVGTDDAMALIEKLKAVGGY